MKTQVSHKSPVIRCPFCGGEYLPGEIFMPGSLIGQPTEVIRDSFGKILYEDYGTESREPDMTEHFICDYCDKPFIIETTITYKTRTEAPENDFSTKYVSLLD